MSPQPITSAIIEGNEKFLIYGDPGTRKTFTALTLPPPIYFLAIGAANEMKPYFSTYYQKKYGSREVQFDVAEEDFDSSRNLKPASGVDNVRRLLEKALEDDYSGKGFQFASMIIDNSTVLSEFMMNKVIEVGGVNVQGDEKDSSTIKKFRESGIMTPADNDWGAEQSMMMRFTSGIFRLDKNVAMVAHEYEKVRNHRATQTQETIAIKPLFVGQSRDRIAAKFDNVWRFTTNGPYTVARTVQGEQPLIIAKTRLGGIIDQDYMNPDLSDVIKKFKEYAVKVKVNPPSSSPSLS